MNNKTFNQYAFPCDSRESATFAGMTLLDYFMAHAPADPQPWFKPVMPELRAAPKIPEGRTPEENSELNAFSCDAMDADEARYPRVRAYLLDLVAWRLECQEWNESRERLRLIQWPRAWAMEQLKERAK